MIGGHTHPASPAVPPGDDASLAPAQLDRALATGLAWTGIAKWSGQLVAWVATLIVARILTPADYGIIALGTVYLGIVTLLAEFGLGSAVVMIRELDDEQIAQINGFALLASLAGIVLSIAVAPLLASFFRTPELRNVIFVMSIAFVLSAPRVVPQSLLQKQLRFRALSAVDACQVATQSIAMVGFAIAGFRYWSIVLGGLAGQFVATGGILLLRRVKLRWPKRASLADALSFSRDVAATRLAWYFYSRADFLISGRVLGRDLTGFYSMAWSLASIPIDKISSLISKVTPAFFSAVQQDPGALRRYFVLLVQALSIVSVPFAIGTALVAPDFVHAVLTSKWAGSIRPLQILSLYAAVASLTAVLTPVLAALRRQRFMMYANLAAAVVLPLGFIVGSHWGTTGIATAWLILHPPIVVALLTAVIRSTTIRWSDFRSAMAPALEATAVMAAAVIALNYTLLHDVSPLTRLAVDAVCGATLYTTIIMVRHPEAVGRFRSAFGAIRSRPTG